MRIVERVKKMIRSWLEIQPAMGVGLTIREPVSFETNVLRNRIWYRGDASEIDQLFRQLGGDAVGQARFWAAVPGMKASARPTAAFPVLWWRHWRR